MPIPIGVFLLYQIYSSTVVSLKSEGYMYPLKFTQHVFNAEWLIDLSKIPTTHFEQKVVSEKLIINYPVWDTSYAIYGRNKVTFLNHYDLSMQKRDSFIIKRMAGLNNSNLLNWYLPLPATNTLYKELELRGEDLSSGFRFNRDKSK